MKFEKLTELIDERITGEWGQEPVSSGVKVIRTTNFTNEGKLDLSNVVERDIEAKKIEKKSLLKGDIIIEKSGGGPTQPVGRVVYFDIESDEKYLCNNFTTILRPKLNLVASKYLLYQMLYLHKSGRTKRYQNKTTGIHNLNLEKYLQEKIALPPLPDQLHIANILSKAENLIAQRKESIRLLDEFLKSTFLEMFGDPGTNPLNWNLIKLESSFLVKPLIGSMVPAIETGTIPIVRVGEIGSKKINFDKCKFSQLNPNDIEKYRLIHGDILLARAIGSESHLGKASIYYDNDKTVVYDSHVMRLRFNSKIINSEYFYTFLQTQGGRKRFMRKAGQTSIQFNINSKQISDIDIPVAPIELQTQFAQIVEKTEALKSQYQQSLQELENLYGSLSQKAFRGELMSER
ncbi:MAG TPA: restriction endonuclease subunit S [Ferruginibacter sp.]|nr:restriction endonuclease subunit S [Ferruginibacter sp.]HMP19314.1 restriction endonuclease subunit S [Ferruginibacter sp.]